MKNFIAKIADAPYALAATVTVAMLPGDALAQENTVGDAAKGLMDDLGNVGKLVVGGAFLGGLVLVAAGLMKLKQAADTQGQQVKYGDGMWRIAVGAGLVAIPAMTGMLTQTLGLGETGDITDAGGAKF